ncbi:hypothetical protein MIR68_012436 [Amoeboaphelidium protococcarum]|nr:hypothetical protein MIR68_012436 [Amoeboaphelidium protococcarum]
MESLRRPMCFLTQRDVENAIGSIANGYRLLLHAPVRRHLFFLGEDRMQITEYNLRLLKEMESIPPDDLLTMESNENALTQIENCSMETWERSLGAINLIRFTIACSKSIKDKSWQFMMVKKFPAPKSKYPVHRRLDIQGCKQIAS